MSLTLLKTIARWGGFACVALLIGFGVKPEGAAAQSFDVSGFVKSSHYYDTRQVVTARDIDFLLYPTPDGNPDADDPSDRDNLSSFLLFSRLGLNVSDFDQQVLGADVRAYMEADFFGPGVFTSGTTRTGQENFFRLRRGFAEMKWDNREVMFGLEWTPLFTLDAFPHTVATEAGAPFNPLSRQPMVKLTLKPTDNLRLIGITAWQFDAFVDAPLANAPEGSNPLGGIDAQQQSALPGLHGHLQYDNGTVLLGVGGYLESLRPFPMGDRFFSGAGTAYGTYTSSNFIARGKVTYGDVRDHVSVGGYIYDPATAGSEFGAADAFKQINTLSTWVEFEKPGTVSPGLFAGYLTNLGVSDALDSDSPSDVAWATRSHSPTGQSIASVWEVAPRLALNYGPMRFAFEVQVTTAQYTTRLDENFAPDPLDSEEAVTNVRGDFTVFLFF